MDATDNEMQMSRAIEASRSIRIGARASRVHISSEMRDARPESACRSSLRSSQPKLYQTPQSKGCCGKVMRSVSPVARSRAMGLVERISQLLPNFTGEHREGHWSAEKAAVLLRFLTAHASSLKNREERNRTSSRTIKASWNTRMSCKGATCAYKF